MDDHKAKIDSLVEEKKNFLEKIRFLESEHNSLIERNCVFSQEVEKVKTFSTKNEIFHPRTSMLNEILENCKSHGDKRGLGYVNKTMTPTSGKTVFVKGKDDIPNQTVPTKIESPKVETPKKINPVCSHCKKSGHNQFRCLTRLLERYESHLNKLMNEFNSLKNNILNTKTGNKTQKGNPRSTPKVKQVWVKKETNKCQVVFTTLKARVPSEWYFDSGCSRHMTGDKSFFTSMEDYNGGVVTFGDGSVAHVRGRGKVAIPGCPDLEGVLYVEGLKANLISISQICDSKFRVNFSQNMCEVIDKKKRKLFSRAIGPWIIVTPSTLTQSPFSLVVGHNWTPLVSGIED